MQRSTVDAIDLDLELGCRWLCGVQVRVECRQFFLAEVLRLGVSRMTQDYYMGGSLH